MFLNRKIASIIQLLRPECSDSCSDWSFLRYPSIGSESGSLLPSLPRSGESSCCCLLPPAWVSLHCQEGRGSGEWWAVWLMPHLGPGVTFHCKSNHESNANSTSQSVGSWPWFYLFSLTDLANLTAERDGVLNKWLEKSTHIELWQSSHAHQKSFSPEHVEGSQGASEQLAASHWEVTGETPGTLERERGVMSVLEHFHKIPLVDTLPTSPRYKPKYDLTRTHTQTHTTGPLHRTGLALV